MIVEKTDFEGLLIVIPDIFEDDRGYFFESYNRQRYTDKGISANFVQDNESMSKSGVIRGLHLQKKDSAQGKLIRIVRGKIFDVAVDLRLNSPTFGKYFSIILDDKEKKQVYIPPGFAHGFASLEDNTILHYKCTNYYNPETELTLLWNDPDIAINWPFQNPIVSDKDRRGMTFKDIKNLILRGEI